MSAQTAYADPMEVRIVDGDIVILGPGNIGVSITMECARESARRLIAAAETAGGVKSGQGDGPHDP